jgi:hypothetical protein
LPLNIAVPEAAPVVASPPGISASKPRASMV